ncbi:carboxymuconolactone decarboxylase family protein [Campylobacter sp. MIT 97-5078]|uniref:carboxymuconolactone decarboxylase family protein n=1 Tax=Campylobacter sp. MIT 97-5078 TaxID=1548153 RepID=UPI000690AF3B|nr:carboxymuconolactone decarboxylase family protein [Campylobacter sp. MIT 97-5078]
MQKRRVFFKQISVLALAFSSLSVYAEKTAKIKENIMKLNQKANELFKKFFSSSQLELVQSDTEFMSNFMNFSLSEAYTTSKLDDKTKFKLILAALVANEGLSEFDTYARAALKAGVRAEEIKEILYQATPYVGFSRSASFIKQSARLFKELKIKLEDNRGTTNENNRFEKGLQAQVELFGEGMRQIPKDMPEDTHFIRAFLSANCFGDYYTRKGLDLKFRELLTFVFLAALGGVEPQLKGHIKGNIRMGNDRLVLISAITVIIPFIGYPKTLNAFSAINELTKA